VAKALSDRYKSHGVTAYSLHPGIVKSNLQANYPGVVGQLAKMSMKITPTISPLDGARTTLYCATSPRAPSNAGRYFVPYGELNDKRSSKWIDDPQKVAKLWELADTQLRQHGFAMQV
jgi:retinol dehydrogenase 12